MNLAFLRIVFFSSLLVCFDSAQLLELAVYWDQGLLREFWEPIPLFSALGLPMLGRTEMTIVVRVWQTAALLSALGLFTRLATMLAFGSGLYVLEVFYQFGYSYHIIPPVILVLFVFAFSPCGDYFALDCLWKKPAGVPRADEYRWSVGLIQLVFVIVFFSAGYAKLFASGSAWFLGNGFRNNVRFLSYYSFDTKAFSTNDSLLAVLNRLLEIPYLAGGLVVGGELASFTLILWGKTRWFVLPVLFTMQFFIWQISGLSHLWFYTAMYLAWIDWEAALAYVRDKGSSRVKTLVRLALLGMRTDPP